MSERTLDFMSRLIAQLPELAHVHREHLDDYDELLPHVFLGEVMRFVVLNSPRKETAGWIDRFLNQVEMGLLSGDDEVGELIAVSFVENLCGENAAIQALLPGMGNFSEPKWGRSAGCVDMLKLAKKMKVSCLA